MYRGPRAPAPSGPGRGAENREGFPVAPQRVKHGGEMTRRSKILSELCPEPIVEVSHEDAARLEVAAGELVQLESRRGTMTATATITERVPAGIVFANFHFPGGQNANVLTNAALDPTAKIPEYKVCAVRLLLSQLSPE